MQNLAFCDLPSKNDLKKLNYQDLIFFDFMQTIVFIDQEHYFLLQTIFFHIFLHASIHTFYDEGINYYPLQPADIMECY